MKTITVKVSELTGIPLCYAVCMLEKPHLVWKSTIGIHAHSHQIIIPELKEPDCYSPYTDWAMCGPVIEREEISLEFNRAGFMSPWIAYKLGLPDEDNPQGGSTPLIAAMRCFVASKFGDTVEIPEELLA